MEFIDMIAITVVGGCGGDGYISFRKKRKKNSTVLGRLKSSNGGNGGNVWLSVDDSLNTLNYFRFNRIFRAENGSRGSSYGCTGRNGKDIFIKVPFGTRVIRQETHELLGDMGDHQKCLMVAKGGRCGSGNSNSRAFYSLSCRYKHQVICCNNNIKGQSGELQHLLLELLLIADVGVFGLPNSGKSSFVRMVSAAKPKVASYPFTTLIPQLGVVQINNDSRFVVADIPGIIKGASTGLGLGIHFLKHLERCQILLHFVDIAPVDNSDPVENIITIEQELYNYSAQLVSKPRWLIFNKIDLLKNTYEINKKVEYIIKSIQWTGRYYMISSIYNVNISSLCNSIMQFIVAGKIA